MSVKGAPYPPCRHGNHRVRRPPMTSCRVGGRGCCGGDAEARRAPRRFAAPLALSDRGCVGRSGPVVSSAGLADDLSDLRREHRLGVQPPLHRPDQATGPRLPDRVQQHLGVLPCLAGDGEDHPRRRRRSGQTLSGCRRVVQPLPVVCGAPVADLPYLVPTRPVGTLWPVEPDKDVPRAGLRDGRPIRRQRQGTRSPLFAGARRPPGCDQTAVN
jgi:hypothetical protein